MKVLEALKLAQTVPLSSPSVHVVSSMESSLFETYFKAYSVTHSFPYQTTSSEFEELSIALLNIFSSANNYQSLLLLLDWEDIIPGSSFRSEIALHNTSDTSLDRVDHIIHIISQSLHKSSIRRVVIVLPVMSSATRDSTSRHLANNQYRQQCLAAVKFADLGLSDSKISVVNPLESLSELSKNSWTNLRGLHQSAWPYSSEVTQKVAQITLECFFLDYERKKIIITDLDDTLWRGAVGEVGVDNLLFQPDVDGYKHFIYQKQLNRLMHEGILVAVCSKNELSIAKAGLDRSDLHFDATKLAGVYAGWGKKSEMIARLLSDLGLLPNSAVFIDDSEFELQEVQTQYPDVVTLLFPKRDSEFQLFINRVHDFFTTNNLTDEDLKRNETYQARNKFEETRQSVNSIGEYLESLNMIAQIDEVQVESDERPLQLINKTNQFNLNGLRETMQSLQNYRESGARILKVKLQDHLADYGIVAVLVIRKNDQFLDIYHFVLSCRVFSRELEHAIINFLHNIAKHHGITTVRARYLSTGKNIVLTNFLKELGISSLPLDQQQPTLVELVSEVTNNFLGTLESSFEW